MIDLNKRLVDVHVHLRPDQLALLEKLRMSTGKPRGELIRTAIDQIASSRTVEQAKQS